jgi:hypothetical protein
MLLHSIFGGLDSVGHSFANVDHFLLLRDIWIRTRRAAVANRRATILANHAISLAHMLLMCVEIEELFQYPHLIPYLQPAQTGLTLNRNRNYNYRTIGYRQNYLGRRDT